MFPNATARNDPRAESELHWKQLFPLWNRGHNIRTIQELLGHRDVKTTMITTHGLNRGPLGVSIPADLL